MGYLPSFFGLSRKEVRMNPQILPKTIKFGWQPYVSDTETSKTWGWTNVWVSNNLDCFHMRSQQWRGGLLRFGKWQMVAVCDDFQLASHESCWIGRSELVRLWKQTEYLEQVLTCSDAYGVMKMFTADWHARFGRSSSWLPSMLRTTCRACTSPERVGASFTLCESCSCNRRSLKQQIEDLKRRSPAMHQPAETANASQEGMHSTPTFLMAEIGRAPSEEWTMWQVMAAPMTSWASLKMWRKRGFLWPSRRVLREGLCTGSWSLSGRTIRAKEYAWILLEVCLSKHFVFMSLQNLFKGNPGTGISPWFFQTEQTSWEFKGNPPPRPPPLPGNRALRVFNKVLFLGGGVASAGCPYRFPWLWSEAILKLGRLPKRTCYLATMDFQKFPLTVSFRESSNFLPGSRFFSWKRWSEKTDSNSAVIAWPLNYVYCFVSI